MSADRDEGFFRRDGDRFVGDDAARGPWNGDACHAGPVTGLVARAFEQAIPDKQLVRVTVNFQRPVPLDGITVEADVTRNGRNTAGASATVECGAGVCATAESIHIARNDWGELPNASVAAPRFEDAIPGKFTLQTAPHGLPFFGDHVEVRYPPGESTGSGPGTMWMRTPPIVSGEQPSPFQSMCPLADCGNGISGNAPVYDYLYVNPDVTVILFRSPASEWLASSATSFWEPSGIGMSQAQLFDTRGAVGFALQTLLVRPVQK